ncbi:rhomboid family intramembrane serine protease [Nonomuraea longicatena]|uniref:Peptidase S54 rhomboid domain-containing protein n=1 Tax=Nonomuraea longicatena TaxID=83682 RepID=A0ABN1QVP9_9ACTN
MNGQSTGRSRFGAMVVEAVGAAVLMVVVVAVMWGVEIMDYVLPENLDNYGIAGWQPSGLIGILFAPFLHVDFGHLLANTLPLLILGFVAAMRGIGRFLTASLLIVLVGGLGTWLTTPVGVVAVGASGLIFGYFGYVVSRGIFDRSLVDILIGIVVAAVYYSMLTGLLPTQEGVSWQGHLFGLVGGVVAAWILRRRARPAAELAL